MEGSATRTLAEKRRKPARDRQVNIRLDDDQFVTWEDFGQEGGSRNLSDFIRAAVDGYILDHSGRPNAERVNLLVGRNQVHALEDLVEYGEFVDLDDAVRTCIVSYLAKTAGLHHGERQAYLEDLRTHHESRPPRASRGGGR